MKTEQNFNDEEGTRGRKTTFSIHHAFTTWDFTAMYYRGVGDIVRTYFQITLGTFLWYRLCSQSKVCFALYTVPTLRHVRATTVAVEKQSVF
jgi:hypothetical protein